MANDISSSLKAAAAKIASYVDNAATLTVQTSFLDIDGGMADFTSANPAARTEIHLDGYSSAVVPVRKNEAGSFVVAGDLFDMHQQVVNTAINYRTNMMHALLQTFNQLTGRPGGPTS